MVGWLDSLLLRKTMDSSTCSMFGKSGRSLDIFKLHASSPSLALFYPTQFYSNKSNPIQSNPIQSNPIQSNPLTCNPIPSHLTQNYLLSSCQVPFYHITYHTSHLTQVLCSTVSLFTIPIPQQIKDDEI